MSVVYVPMPRDTVLSYLGPSWPPAPAALLLRVPESAAVTDGAVNVYEFEGRPGVTWWLVDGAIPPQDAGPVDEALAALVPGSVLVEQEPPPEPETPPITHAHGLSADLP